MNTRREWSAVDSWRVFLEGDRQALESLVRAYSDGLVRFAYCYIEDSAAAEDIMEEAFAVLVCKRKRFDESDNLRAYLYKMVRNKCIDYLRVHKKIVPLSDTERVCVGSAESDLLFRENNRTLYRCMQQLPKQYREILYLAYFEDYGAEEISRILKYSKKQIYNLLSRARTSLKELLIKEGFSYEDL